MKQKDVEEKPIEDMKQETLQDPDSNEGKNPPESTWRLDEENLLKNKVEITFTLEEMDYSAGCTYVEIKKYDFFDFKDKMLETLKKYQEGTTMLKQLLKKQEEENIRLKSERLKQEEENIKLKSERLEQEEEKEKVSKNISEDLEETRMTNIGLKTQVKEVRSIEEVLKDQLNEKEMTCQKLEMEMVDLRKKDDKNNAHVKFKNNSTILSDILDCQRSPFDKTGLGYNKEIKESKADMNPSSSRVESKTAPQVPAQDKEDIQTKGHQGASPTPLDKFKKETTHRWNQTPRYGNGFYGYCFSFSTFGHKALDYNHHAGRAGWNQNPRYEKSSNGYCFSCKQFGHKALDCRNHAKESVGNFEHSIKCWTCN